MSSAVQFIILSDMFHCSQTESRFRMIGEQCDQGPIFCTFFSGENFWENSAENFPQKMLGKIVIFRGKSFEKSFFQEIPRNFPRKITFRGKKCTKNRPQIGRSFYIGTTGKKTFLPLFTDFK
jgi:hypothetical protein